MFYYKLVATRGQSSPIVKTIRMDKKEIVKEFEMNGRVCTPADSLEDALKKAVQLLDVLDITINTPSDTRSIDYE